jgi:hypothetical protein
MSCPVRIEFGQERHICVEAEERLAPGGGVLSFPPPLTGPSFDRSHLDAEQSQTEVSSKDALTALGLPPNQTNTRGQKTPAADAHGE